MMTLTAIVLTALGAGFGAKLLRLPPLLGFLLAGFALNFAGFTHQPNLEIIADLGVTILLFTIGLELDLRSLFRREVIGVGLVHMSVSTLGGAGLFALLSLAGFSALTGVNWKVFFLLGFALSFSSTVFVIKVLLRRGDERTRYGVIAIGILVIQDLVAVVFISASGGKIPSLWAIALLALPLVKPVFGFLLDRAGHSEMLILFGVGVAVGFYTLFTYLGLKGDLGALVGGLLLSSHPRADELFKSLENVKELLLVGFFVQIGLHGLPGGSQLLIALILILMLPLKAGLFTVLFHWFHLRARTTALASTVMSNYSEFALIIVSVAMGAGWLTPDWVVTLSITVAGGLVLSSLINRRSHRFADHLGRRLPTHPIDKLIPEERPVSLEGVNAVIIGMGRIGVSAYDRLSATEGVTVRGVDSCSEIVANLRAQGYDIIEGDATDPDLWGHIHDADDVAAVVLALPDHGANNEALEYIAEADVEAYTVVAARHLDHVNRAYRHGADEAIYLYQGAGMELADATLANSALTEFLPQKLVPRRLENGDSGTN